MYLSQQYFNTKEDLELLRTLGPPLFLGAAFFTAPFRWDRGSTLLKAKCESGEYTGPRQHFAEGKV